MNQLTNLHAFINSAIFTIKPACTYQELTAKFIELCDIINKEDNDSEWYHIGEHSESELGALVAGAMWHYTEWHSGQFSDSYAALSACSGIYDPGMTCAPDDSDEYGYDAYTQLAALAVHDKINTEWDAMLTRGIMPLFELEIINDEYLLVELAIQSNGIKFSFDSDNKPVSFDGDIEVINDNHYVLPFDNDHTLNQHLEMIMGNLTEGYLCPNNLMRDGE